MLRVHATVGLQYGDEGKGRITEYLVHQLKPDIVMRYNGGANAGHTIQIGEETHKLRQLPAGVFHKECGLLIGQCCLVDPRVLLEEIQLLDPVYDVRGRVMVAQGAHLITPTHLLIDRLEEEDRKVRIGSTLTGTTPAFRDKVGRVGIRAGQMQRLCGEALLKGSTGKSDDEWAAAVDELRECITLVDPHELLHRRRKITVLAEGAQGMELDLDWGDYPWVSSSSFSAAFACISGGFSPRELDQIWGVFKPYTTRVGTGKLTADISETPLGEWIRKAGNEFGTVTGRPRRIGLLSMGEVDRFARMNGCTHLALTKADIPAQRKGEWGYIDRTGQMRHWTPEGSVMESVVSLRDELKVSASAPIALTSYGPERGQVIDI